MIVRFTLAGLVCVAFAVGCGGGTGSTSAFESEFQLTLRAGRGQWTETEKLDLLSRNHPILAQIGEPRVRPLMELFANLPDSVHSELMSKSYIKWRYADLPADSQRVVADLIQFSIQTRLVNAGANPHPDAILVPAMLDDVDVGFAIVQLGAPDQKVVSWYASGAQLPLPLWITVVNAPAATSQDYVKAHLQRLPLLRPLQGMDAAQWPAASLKSGAMRC